MGSSELTAHLQAAAELRPANPTDLSPAKAQQLLQLLKPCKEVSLARNFVRPRAAGGILHKKQLPHP